MLGAPWRNALLTCFILSVSSQAVTSQSCGGLVNGTGLLQSINYPQQYINNHICTWTLHASPANGYLNLQFLTFSTESCCDYVKIYNESQALIRSYAGQVLPPSLTIGSRATVVFRTDSSAVSEGFSIRVSTVGPASITFSSNPVYAGQPVTLTCSYGTGVALVNGSLEAFSEDFREGSLWCSVPMARTTGQGVFLGNSFVNCPTFSAGSTTISISMVASQLLELRYSFSAVLTDSYGGTLTVTSPSVSLEVLVLPSTPKFWPSPIVFNDNDNAVIMCDSRNGKPPAVITLIISGSTRREATAIDSATLVLPLPLTNWQKAMATCSVTNHNFSSMTVSRAVTINFIRSIGVPLDVNTTESGAVLDCSSYISSFPGVYYWWSVSPKSGSTNGSLLSRAIFNVQQWQTGLINCTATNVITMKNVSVVFNLISLPSPSTFAVLSSNSTCEQCWIIAPVAGRILISVVVFILLFKRVFSLKWNLSTFTHYKGTSGTISGDQCNVTNASLEPVDRQYESLSARLFVEPTYAQLTNYKPFDDVVVYENFTYVKDNFQIE